MFEHSYKCIHIHPLSLIDTIQKCNGLVPPMTLSTTTLETGGEASYTMLLIMT